MHKKSTKLIIATILLLIAGIALLKLREPKVKQINYSQNNKGLLSPDIVILTKKLSDLPKDLLKNTFLKEILSEDILSYYEEDPSYLGLIGTLKRLTYENGLSFKESVIRYILSLPAEVAMWKGGNGKIKDFLMLIDQESYHQDFLKTYIQLKKMLGDDAVESFSYLDREGYYIKYGSQKLVVWSNDKKLCIGNISPNNFPESGIASLEKYIEKNYESDIGESFYSRLYNTKLGEKKHSIILSSRFLSFGYNYFFPSLLAVKINFLNKHWKMYSLIKNLRKKQISDLQSLWNTFPKGAAFCGAFPLSKQRLISVLGGESSGLKQSELDELMSRPMGVCWYSKSKIYTPLFLAKRMNNEKIINLKDEKIQQKLKQFFEYTVGSLKSKKLKDKTIQYYKKVKSTEPTFYINNDLIAFSPDRKNIDFIKASYKKKNPSLSDQYKMSNQKSSFSLLNLHEMMKVLKSYIKESIPYEGNSIFRKTLISHTDKMLEKTRNFKTWLFKIDTKNVKESSLSKWTEINLEEL